MAIVTTSTLTSPVQRSFDSKLLAIPHATLIHKTCASLKTMPARSGKTLRMRRYEKLGTATVPLGNSGVTPPGKSLEAVDIDATIGFYGTYIQINEQVTLQAADPVLNESVKLLGICLRETEDSLTRDMLAATASVVHCGGGVNGDNPTELTHSDIDGIVKSLLSSNANTITDSIQGEDRFGTAPVRDAYIAMTHSNMASELEGVAGFLHKNQYPSNMAGLRSEWGAIGNVRFLTSSEGSITEHGSADGEDVYNTFITGLDAYAIVDQAEYSSQFIYLPPSIAGGPLALNASAGFKMATAQAILNDEWILNLKSTLS